MQSPIAIDLFSGAGGIAIGVERAGYRTLFAIDNEPTAVATVNLNRAIHFPDLVKVEPMDIRKADPFEIMRRLEIVQGELDLLVGGPPCVAFSKSGFHLEYKLAGKDPRATLLDEYLKFVSAMRPRAYMIENVFGLAYRNHSAPFFQRLKDGLTSLGYSVSYEILNAADFGVPQNRQRLFIIGRSDGRDLRLPRPTHWGEHERRPRTNSLMDLRPHVTTSEAFQGLVTVPEDGEAVNGKYGHLLPEIPPGRNYLHFTAHEGHPHPLFEWRSRYWTFLLKLDPNRPSSTIQSQPGPYVGPFHWENRRLRVPELMRLQGFPDGYSFAGTRRDVQVQIGNAVPPSLSYAVASAIRRQMDSAEQTEREIVARQLDFLVSASFESGRDSVAGSLSQ